MVTLNDAVAVFAGELESVTFIVNDEFPALVGTPVMSPAALSVKPAGKAPEEIDHVYGVLPPPAYKKAE